MKHADVVVGQTYLTRIGGWLSRVVVLRDTVDGHGRARFEIARPNAPAGAKPMRRSARQLRPLAAQSEEQVPTGHLVDQTDPGSRWNQGVDPRKKPADTGAEQVEARARQEFRGASGTVSVVVSGDQPQIEVRPMAGAHERSVAAELYRLAAALENASIRTNERWFVAVTNHRTVGFVRLEMSSGSRAEVARAIETLRAVAVASG